MSPRLRCHSAGFTLLELMITVVVVAILAAVALPSYQDQIRKGRRAEAREMIMNIMAAQERWRSVNTSYASALDATGLNITVPADANYSYAITGAGAAGYTITATAKAKQAGDSTCATMGMQVGAQSLQMANGEEDSDGSCWPR